MRPLLNMAHWAHSDRKLQDRKVKSGSSGTGVPFTSCLIKVSREGRNLQVKKWGALTNSVLSLDHKNLFVRNVRSTQKCKASLFPRLKFSHGTIHRSAGSWARTPEPGSPDARVYPEVVSWACSPQPFLSPPVQAFHFVAHILTWSQSRLLAFPSQQTQCSRMIPHRLPGHRGWHPEGFHQFIFFLGVWYFPTLS